MGRFTIKITKLGMQLLAGNVGKSLIFTKALCGSNKVDIDTLEDLTSINASRNLSITEITPHQNNMKIRLQLNNDNLQNSFNLHQIGLFAKYSDSQSDVLYMIMQTDTPDYIPSCSEAENFICY